MKILNGAKIAFLSVLSNTFIVSLKLIVGVLTGSVAIISEAIHSSLDLVASLIAFSRSDGQVVLRIKLILMVMAKWRISQGRLKRCLFL